MNTIEIIIENNNQRVDIKQGTSLAELAKKYSTLCQYPILGALVNNEISPLDYRIYNPKCIRFIDITDRQGLRMYNRSVIFMLYKALHDVFPQAKLRVEHSTLCGTFCYVEGLEESGITPIEIARQVRDRMSELQQADLPFEHKTMLLKEALELLDHAPATKQLLGDLSQLYITMQSLDGITHKLATKLVPSTGCLTVWDFRPYADGFLIQSPDFNHPGMLSLYQETPKLFSIFREHYRWAKLLQVPNIAKLNETIRAKQENHLIHVAEALHEKKYAAIADEIYQRRDEVKMVLLAGPSSSGKTTSCRRLAVQLSVLGFDVHQISLDDYFLARDLTPRLPNGDYDFECLEALDIPLLNDHMQRLFNGEEVKMPTYNFITGKPEYRGNTLCLQPRNGKQPILIAEGIHALNPKLTAQIDDKLKFKVYVSALTQISIDDQNIIHTSDNRLIRRIVRDNNFRGYSALDTLKRWESVRHGEEQHIFPFQEEADAMFNSALLYELALLKPYAEPLLKRVPENCPEYAEARRLLDFLEMIEPIDPKHIPPTSILREFLGGSSFEY